MHLEWENQWDKDEETIEKLIAETEPDYIPHNVIGIQNINSEERIQALNSLVVTKNKAQLSNVLMIYRFYDRDLEVRE
ncbi:hypothetical protein [Alkalihalobacterium sp. APHAB7]|uniref:hypothetical protein n=1 Tax=Alkalihalobacterium sp. APHAB7 TaxID=3402081 RepID=UPI003AAD41DF